MHFTRHISYWGTERADKPALTFLDKTITWAELNALADTLMAELHRLGIKAGDRVGCLLPNNLEWCIAFAASCKTRSMFVPLNAMFGQVELRHIARDSGVKAVFSTEALMAKISDRYTGATDQTVKLFDLTGASEPMPFPLDIELKARSEAPSILDLKDDDPIAICYTSGTSGLPKGAVHTHSSVSAMCEGWTKAYGMSYDDVLLLVAPLAFTGGIISHLAMSLFLGCHLVVEPSFNPPRVVELFNQYKVTSFGGATIFWSRIRELPEFETADFSSVVRGFTGGAPVPPQLLRDFQKRGICIRQHYGCTEAAGGVTVPTMEEALEHPEACGRAMMALDMELRNEAGERCKPGEPGEICLRGSQLMHGYWNNPEATAEAFCGDWYKTGDIGYLNDRGAVVIIDRKKSMIISGGVNVYPAEVERALVNAEGVREALVTGIPSDNWGEEIIALLVAEDGLDLVALSRRMRDELGGYKCPKQFFLVEEPFPRTMTGKVDRKQLPSILAALKCADPAVRQTEKSTGEIPEAGVGVRSSAPSVASRATPKNCAGIADMA